MKLPRVRFTVRRMMVAVAAMAVLSTCLRLLALSREYDRKSMRNGILSAMSRHHHGYQVKYFGDLSEKYSRAARRPWVSVEPDPPRPEPPEPE